MTKRVLALAVAMIGTGMAAGVYAQEGPGAPPAGRGRGGAATAAATQAKPAEPRNDSSTTTSTLTPSGRAAMAYTAVAGYMPLKDEQDKLRANIFYVAYTAGVKEASATAPATNAAPATQAGATTMVGADSKRPITFVFNGGPGAASVWLHMGAVGPKRIEIPTDGSPPVAPFHVVDNEYSWLPATDLVFIDPVNTGYSRAATPEQSREFLGVREDISSVGEFVRLYLTKYQRWGSRVFLAGESYGTTRAAGLANYLQDRVGVSVSGVTLISAVLNFATLSPSESNDMPFALFLPTYASVGWYHKKVPNPTGGLDALLKDAETFAMGDYTTALNKGSGLSDADRQRVAKRFSDLTGLSTEYVLSSNLRVSPDRFEKELLRGKEGQAKVIGRYDGRLTGWSNDATSAGQDYDPSFSGFYTAYTSAFNEYVRNTLKYDNDIPYEVLSGRVQPWNYASGGATNSYLYVGDDLRDAMTQNPNLRLLVCSGHFDLATPYFATDYTLNHLTLSPEIRKNISQAYFPGGHMIYHVREGLEKLYHDETSFIEK